MKALIRARPFQYDSRLKRQHDWRPEPTMIARFCMNARLRTCKVATLVAWLILLVSLRCAPRSRLPSSRQTGRAYGRPASKNVESFEVVWKTIRDKHFDPKLGGLDWQAVHDASAAQGRGGDDDERCPRRDERSDRTAPPDALRDHPAELYEGLRKPGRGTGRGRARCSSHRRSRRRLSRGGGRPRQRRGGQDRLGRRQDRRQAGERALSKRPRPPTPHTGLVPAYQMRAVRSTASHGAVGSKLAVDFLDDKDKPVHLDLIAGEPAGVPAIFRQPPHVSTCSSPRNESIGRSPMCR